MPYFGPVKPTETTSSVLRSTYTGDGLTTTFNLPGPVANETSIIATINGVTQQDAAYTTNGSQIIFASAPSNGDAIELRTISDVGMSYAPSTGSVTTGILADGAVTSGKLASGAAVANIGARAITAAQVPAGSVLQVVQTYKTDIFSTTSTTFVDITGLSVSITPSSTNSKIWVFASVQTAGQGFADRLIPLRLVRNSTDIGLSDQSGSNRLRTSGGRHASNQADSGVAVVSFLDSPNTTSSVTYKVTTRIGTGGTIIIGRDGDTEDDQNRASYPSSITVMEIAG